MSENKKFQNWQEVIVDFFKNKTNVEEERYLKEELKKIDALYRKENYYNKQELQDFFSSKKSKKDKNQSSLEFQQEKLQKVFEFKNNPLEFNKKQTKENYENKCSTNNKKYSPHQWLTTNSENAKSVSFATHVAKLTHSKIDTPSFYDNIDSQKNNQLSTSALRNKAIDGAVAGNQFAPIFQFLELELNGKKLASEFSDESNIVLKPFVKEGEDLNNWNKGFKQSLSSKQLSSHALAKQIYFPINNNTINNSEYHLLCNVKSSSIAHAIYENVFNKNEKHARELRSKDKYSEVLINSFLSKAKVSVTISNHSNASQLNAKRGGKIFLYSTQPPTWQSQLKPPLHTESMFYAYYSSSNTKENIDYLADFLMRFKDLNLSIKDPKRKQHLDRWVNNIVDDWLFYVGSIQNLSSGWSEDSKLKKEHQCLLDPYREDESFQVRLKTTAWQTVVCDDFAKWLNKKLKAKNNKFTPRAEHTRMWRKLIATPLREYSENIVFDIFDTGETKA